MDASRFRLRPFTDSDFGSYAEVRTAARPNYPISVETLRHWDAAIGTPAVKDRYVVELCSNGEVVGVGGLGEDPAHPRKYWIHLFVRPVYQRLGIGGALFETVLDAARRRTGECLRTSVQTGEAAGLDFSSRRGFTERARDWQSVLEVRTVDTGSLPERRRRLKEAGIEITTLAQEGAGDPEVLRRVHALDQATAPDAPQMDPYVPWTLEQFREGEMEGALFLPEAWFLAKVGDEYVAGSWARREPADPGLLQQDWTGTRPEYRRHGLARTLKLGLIEYAQRNGFARIRTNNSSLNAPMWQLNEQLGFRRISTTLQLERPLA